MLFIDKLLDTFFWDVCGSFLIFELKLIQSLIKFYLTDD